MKRWEIIVLVFAILFFGFLFSRDFLARAAWQKYHSPAAALALASQDAKLLMNLGNYYFNGTIGKSEYNLEKAKRAFAKAVAADPKILWGHYQLARIYFVEGDFRRALEEINRELEANPENLRALYVRGLIYGYQGHVGDLAEAEEDFRHFTMWAPSEWAGYNDLAWILSKEGKYDEAKSSILRAFENITEGRKNPWLWNALGVAELNLGEYKNAEKSFEKAMELAGKLDLSEWRKAYPGNDPASADSGFGQFQETLRKNLERAEALGAI